MCCRYTEHEFDKDFIDVLYEQCYLAIQNRGTATIEEVMESIKESVRPDAEVLNFRLSIGLAGSNRMHESRRCWSCAVQFHRHCCFLLHTATPGSALLHVFILCTLDPSRAPFKRMNCVSAASLSMPDTSSSAPQYTTERSKHCPGGDKRRPPTPGHLSPGSDPGL